MRHCRIIQRGFIKQKWYGLFVENDVAVARTPDLDDLTGLMTLLDACFPEWERVMWQKHPKAMGIQVAGR